MRALIQRVSEGRVVIAGRVTGEIESGLLILVCAMSSDNDENARLLAKKIVSLRIFKDERGKMNKSLLDVGGAALIVSQFTLAADTSRGNRPGFSSAANPEVGKRLYELFCDFVRQAGVPVATGEFGADMKVNLINDGPVTIWLEL